MKNRMQSIKLIVALLVTVMSVFLSGCQSTAETFMKEIRWHSEDATLRAKTKLSQDPELRNYKDAQGRTPLHAAANYCNFDLVNRLLDEGADPNAQDNDGNTPLHLAIDPQVIKDFNEQEKENAILANRLYGENRSITNKLLKVTDQNIKNNDGKTAQELFKEKYQWLDGANWEE